MNWFKLLVVALIVIGCAPDAPEDLDCMSGTFDCHEIANTFCEWGYPAFCNDWNPELVWCIKQLREDTPDPDFWDRCSEFFMQEAELI